MKRGGEEWLPPDEAIQAIQQARESGVPLFGFDGGYLTDISTQPSLADSKDYSVPEYPNVLDPYGDAIRFIGDRGSSGLLFVLVFGRPKSN